MAHFLILFQQQVAVMPITWTYMSPDRSAQEVCMKLLCTNHQDTDNVCYEFNLGSPCHQLCDLH